MCDSCQSLIHDLTNDIKEREFQIIQLKKELKKEKEKNSVLQKEINEKNNTISLLEEKEDQSI